MTRFRPPDRRTSLFAMTVAYFVALVVGWTTGMAVASWDADAIVVAGAADLAATLVIFAFSRRFDNSSMYDPYWSVAPIPIVVYWAVAASDDATTARQALVLTLVSFWGIRLTWNFVRGWSGLDHEDWRYVDIRKKAGRLYWPASLFGIHLFPTVQVFLGCLPAYAALTSTRPLGWLDGFAALVTFGGAMIEAVADQQLRVFLKRDKKPGTIMSDGLWGLSRHPNYFGEMTFWWGLALFGVAAGVVTWWTFAGAVAISVMFLAASLPMIEKRSRERRPGYTDHAKRVSLIVPWFPKR